MNKEAKYIASLDLPTPDGTFRAHYSEAGLAQLDFPDPKRPSAAPSQNPNDCTARWHQATRQALDSVIQGRPITKMPPLDLSHGTAFQRRVWAEMQRIPFGKTTTYGAIAATLGKPTACRAVGAACGANPLPLIIPCHRVVPSTGKLGNYIAGSAWKERLLRAEQGR